MSKILIVSHSPRSSTGYGRVVRALAGSLQAAGNEIVCLGAGSNSADISLPYSVLPWKNLSAAAISDAIKSHRPHILLTIGDPWMFEQLPQMTERNSVCWVAYYPVDGFPLPQSWKNWTDTIDVPIVFSKFARDVVKSATGKAPTLIYHGVNTSTFCPQGRDKAKALANVNGHFVVGTVARNQMRKNIPALIKAFARFARDKDDALLYLHTQMKGEFDISELVHNAGISQKTRVTGDIKSDQGVTDHLLATVYRAMDVFVLPTMAEGFGLPIMEAQACGTPALVTDFSACPELVPEPIQRVRIKDTITMARNFEQAVVDVDDIVTKLELLYTDRKLLGELSATCHRFAQAFDWRLIYHQFNNLLTSQPVLSLVNARSAANAKIETGPFSQKRIATQTENNHESIASNVVDLEFDAIHSDDVEQLHSAALERMKAGKTIQAIPLLRRVVDLRPQNPDFLNQLGVALHVEGKVSEAVVFLRRSVAFQPTRHQIWANLIRSHLKLGELVEAKETCLTAIKLAPNSAQLYELQGSILHREGQSDEARISFERALSLEPTLTSSIAHLAEIHLQERKLTKPSYSVPKGLTEATALESLNHVVAKETSYPGGFEGRGIVIVGGGIRYFPCAWICIRMLRELGCQLPLELWHLGPEEMSDQMRDLLAPYNVHCIDGQAYVRQHQSGEIGGWELKAYALTYSRFQEALLLDADNFPLVDPAFLFDTLEFQRHGAIFWPDHGKLLSSQRIWDLTGVAYQDEAAFESGQIVVDKRRCWKALQLSLWFNQNSSFWYHYILGDKDTFHLAWRKIGLAYEMPKTKLVDLPYAIAQHDFQGRRIFQHRNRAKWVLSGWNARMVEFENESRGFELLEELRAIWNPEIPSYRMTATELVQAAWNSYSAGVREDVLSIKITDPRAWKLIGMVAAHTSHCIIDAHFLNVVERALTAAPELAELRAMLGTSFGTLGRHTEAVQSFLAAYHLRPTLPGLAHNLRLAVKYSGMFEIYDLTSEV